MNLAATAQEERRYRNFPNFNVYSGTGVEPQTPEVWGPEILTLLSPKRSSLSSTSLNTKVEFLVVTCDFVDRVRNEYFAGKRFIGGNAGNLGIQSAHFQNAEPVASAASRKLAQVVQGKSILAEAVPRAVSRTEMLVTIQNAFALNVTQLAEILNVTRVTIYQWRKEDAAPLKEESRARLQQLYGLATFWRGLATVPGAQLHEYIAGMNTTLEATLKQSDVDRDQLGKIHAALLRAESSQVRRQRAVQTQREALAKLKANLVDTPVPGVIAD